MKQLIAAGFAVAISIMALLGQSAAAESDTVRAAMEKGHKAMTADCLGCHPGMAPAFRNGSSATKPSRPVFDGASLYYTNNCASCHGPTSNMKGTTAAMIRAAIDSNRGGMGFHSNLTGEQIEAIATALNQQSVRSAP